MYGQELLVERRPIHTLFWTRLIQVRRPSRLEVPLQGLPGKVVGLVLANIKNELVPARNDSVATLLGLPRATSRRHYAVDAKLKSGNVGNGRRVGTGEELALVFPVGLDAVPHGIFLYS